MKSFIKLKSIIQSFLIRKRESVQKNFSRFPLIFQSVKVGGKVFSIIFLCILFLVLYATWESGQIFRMADQEHPSDLNFDIKDYQDAWSYYSAETNTLDQQANVATPYPPPIKTKIHTRSITVDLSRDFMDLDLSLYMNKDSELAKAIVLGEYWTNNDEILDRYFGKITWGDEEVSFEYDAITWELNEQTNEFVVHLRQHFPYNFGMPFLVVNYSQEISPENDIFLTRLDDGFRLIELSPFPSRATMKEFEIKGSPSNKFGSVSFTIDADPDVISIVREDEWAVFVSNVVQKFGNSKTIQNNNYLRGLYYVLPLIIFCFWSLQKVNNNLIHHLLKTTIILLILYFSVYVVSEASYTAYGSNIVNFFPSLFVVLFRSTEFLKSLTYVSSSNVQFSIYQLSPIMLGVIVPTLLLRYMVQSSVQNTKTWKYFAIVFRVFAIIYLATPLLFGLSRWFLTGFFSSGDLVLFILSILLIFMYACIYVISYLLLGKTNLDWTLLVIVIIASGFIYDVLYWETFWVESATVFFSILTQIHIFLRRVYGFIYLFLFVYSIIYIGIFALSKTNWSFIRRLQDSIKWRIIISTILTLVAAAAYSTKVSLVGDFEKRLYADLTMGLASNLIESIPYLWGFLVLIYLSVLGRSTSKIDPEARYMGILASCTMIMTSFSYEIPVQLILTLLFLLYFSRRPDKWWENANNSHQKYLQDSQRWIDKAVNLVQIEKASKEFRKKHYEKLVDNTITASQYEEDVLSRKNEVESLRNKDFDGNSPRDILFSFGPYQSATKNGLYGAAWSVIFAIPWMILFFPDLVITWGYPQYSTLGEMLWNIITNSIQLITEWAVYGFLFGYFYCYWRGTNGLTKALWFFCAFFIPYMISVGLAIFENFGQSWYESPTLFSVLFWPLQILLLCLLLGVIAFEYFPIRKHHHDFQTLLEINGVANFGVSVSAILLTLSTSIISVLTNQTMELLRYTLPALFNGGPTPPP